jgi:hypothetical protein
MTRHVHVSLFRGLADSVNMNATLHLTDEIISFSE